MALVPSCAARGCKSLGELVAGIGLRRLQASPIGGDFRTSGIDRHKFMTNAMGSSLHQQLLDDPLRLSIPSLAELMVANTSPCIDEIESRPNLVVEGAPYCVVVVDRNRIIDLHVIDRPADVIDVLLERELRSLHTDYHQSLSLVLFGPCTNVGECAQGVNAGIGPEIDEDDFSSQARSRQWLRVEPRCRAAERRQLTFD